MAVLLYTLGLLIGLDGIKIGKGLREACCIAYHFEYGSELYQDCQICVHLDDIGSNQDEHPPSPRVEGAIQTETSDPG